MRFDYKCMLDRELVLRFCENRDEKAFEEIFNRYFEKVYRFVQSRVLDREKAQDITSSVFGILIDNLQKFHSESNLQSFIFGIAINKVRHSWRDKSLYEESFLEIFDVYEEDEEEEIQNDLIKYLPLILDSLPINYKNILEERFIKGHTTIEIGTSMNLSPNNVRVLIHRALKKASIIGNKILENEKKN